MAAPKKKTSKSRTSRRFHAYMSRKQQQLLNRVDAFSRLAGKKVKDKKSKVVTVEA